MHGTWRVGGVSAEIRRKECAGFLQRLNEGSLFLEERGPRGKGNLEQGGGLCGLGHGGLESWYRLKKETGAAGSVLGGGSFWIKR